MFEILYKDCDKRFCCVWRWCGYGGGRSSLPKGVLL